LSLPLVLHDDRKRPFIDDARDRLREQGKDGRTLLRGLPDLLEEIHHMLPQVGELPGRLLDELRYRRPIERLRGRRGSLGEGAEEVGQGKRV
jgi:hypothetical protein